MTVKSKFQMNELGCLLFMKGSFHLRRKTKCIILHKEPFRGPSPLKAAVVEGNSYCTFYMLALSVWTCMPCLIFHPIDTTGITE